MKVSQRTTLSGLFLATWSTVLLVCAIGRAEIITEQSVRYHDIETAERLLPVYAVRLGGDSLVYCTQENVFIQVDAKAAWQRVFDGDIDYESIPTNHCDRKKNIERLFSMEGLWRIKGTNEIVTYDGYCRRLFSLFLQEGRNGSFSRWDHKIDEDHPPIVNIQGDLVLCGMGRYGRDRGVLLHHVGESRYEEVFECSASLAHRLDSVGIGSGDRFCFPAFGPADSSLWIAIYGYDYIYVTDIRGRVRDSVHISASDYKVPPQIKSRIRSMAVSIEWMSQWTMIKSFHYVSPGYFLLQYSTGFGYHEKSVKSYRYSTQLWDAGGNFVSLNVDPHWQIAGVQPDGEVIFASYHLDGENCRLELHIARIVP